ncbi:MAG: aldehyde dehydrogenase family protein, partial [Phycisphaerae bacterium]|nr:aldehyde dehydrogenase family protein [Phycisphaerae bacterium]
MPKDLLQRLGIARDARIVPSAQAARAVADGKAVATTNPATGAAIATVRLQDIKAYTKAVEAARAVQPEWAECPAPKRGEIVRLIGQAFRDEKDALGEIVTREMGKILPEGLGEIQECVDIADFAVGLSRQIYGLTIASERVRHRMYEQWHPLGTIGIITAFNFPAAVWAWNSMLAAVCGDTMVWKPSLITPLTAIAMTRVAHDVMRSQDVFAPKNGRAEDVFGLVIGADANVGEAMLADRRLPLISATGSCRMGRRVASVVGGRLGRTLLELGGNNAIIVMPDADMDLVTRGVLFGAVGTAGQRCTSTRRLLVHQRVAKDLTARLVKAYRSVPIGDPMKKGTLMGPLINERAVAGMRAAIEQAEREGCTVLCGGVKGIEKQARKAGHWVEPTIIQCPANRVPKVCCEETFAPILYVLPVKDLDHAIALNNSVDQGLSSAIFTDSVRSSERFLGAL